MTFSRSIVRPRRDRMPLALTVGLVVGGVVALALIVTADVARHRRAKLQATAEASYWAVTGPPCVEIGKEAFAKLGMRPTHDFGFLGLHFFDLAGAADCNGESAYDGAPWDWRECMFTGPAVLRVKNGDQDAYFAPGVGQPVTIRVTKAGLSCVLASHYTVPLDPRWKGFAQ